jgi:uridine kinase
MHTKEAHRLAKVGIATIRKLLKQHEMAIHLKERYRMQLRLLRRIAKSTKREAETIKGLIQKLRGDTTPAYPHEINPFGEN